MEQDGINHFIYKMRVEEAVTGDYVCAFPAKKIHCLRVPLTPGILKLDRYQLDSIILSAKFLDFEQYVHETRELIKQSLGDALREIQLADESMCIQSHSRIISFIEWNEHPGPAAVLYKLSGVVHISLIQIKCRQISCDPFLYFVSIHTDYKDIYLSLIHI